MKSRLLPIFLLIFLLASNSIAAFSQTVTNIELKDTEGNYTRIDDLKGEKLTVLDFWATWCKPCVKSIPELIKLSTELQGKGVQFIAVNEDSPRNISKVRPFANALGITYPVLLDTDQEVMTDLLVSVFPTLIILNNKGEIVYSHEGYSKGDEEIFREKIEALLSDGE